MHSQSIRATLTSTEPVLGAAYVSVTETLDLSPDHNWEPAYYDLWRDGQIRIRLQDSDSDRRADLVFTPQRSCAREALESAVVSYVAQCGSYWQESAAADKAQLLERLAGALESARADFAKSAERHAAQVQEA
jgi:hypothetical protein